MIGSTLARILCILVGHVYPLYRTFKACHLPEGTSVMEPAKVVEMKRILSFWAVHGVFTFAEYFVDFFVWWMPLYFEAKLLALLCLVGANFGGAIFVFENLIEEVLGHHEFEIDASLDKSKAAMRQVGGKMFQTLCDGASSVATIAMRKWHAMLLEGVSPVGERESRSSAREHLTRFEDVTESDTGEHGRRG